MQNTTEQDEADLRRTANYRKYRLKPLPPEKVAIMEELFPVMSKTEIAPILGYSPNVVTKYAQALQIRKTPEYLHKQAVLRGYRLAGINKKNGFLPVGRKFKPGESLKDKVGAEAFAEMHRKAIETRAAIYKRERQRMLCGFEPRVKAKLMSRPRRKIALETRLRKSGYICLCLNRWLRPRDVAEKHKRMEATAVSWGYKLFDTEDQQHGQD